jgi:hypothetical protein
MCQHQQIMWSDRDEPGFSPVIIRVPHDARTGARLHDVEALLAANGVILDWSLWDAQLPAAS